MTSFLHSKSHSFIESLCGYPRGTLLRLKEGEKYEEHSHSTILQAKPVGISSKKVAPLTEKECLLLDAIASPEVRYNVHTSPGLLEWAVGLKEGETVLARLSKHSSDNQDCLYVTVVIRWVGAFQWRSTAIAHDTCLEWRLW